MKRIPVGILVFAWIISLSLVSSLLYPEARSTTGVGAACYQGGAMLCAILCVLGAAYLGDKA